MKGLLKQKCAPCKEGDEAMSLDNIKSNLSKLDGWIYEGNSILKYFEKKDFVEAVSFVNKIAKLAEDEKHHPDIKIFSYKRVQITLLTHVVGGLSINDFILAAKIDQITA